MVFLVVKFCFLPDVGPCTFLSSSRSYKENYWFLKKFQVTPSFYLVSLALNFPEEFYKNKYFNILQGAPVKLPLWCRLEARKSNCLDTNLKKNTVTKKEQWSATEKLQENLNWSNIYGFLASNLKIFRPTWLLHLVGKILCHVGKYTSVENIGFRCDGFKQGPK